MIQQTACQFCRIVLLTILMVNWVVSSTYGQDQLATKVYFLSVLETTFDIDPDTFRVCDYYLLDGEAIYFSQVQDQTVSPSIRSIDYVLLTSEMFPANDCDLLLIVRSDSPQSKAEKRRLLQKAQAEFQANDDIQALHWRCGSCKMISIDQEFYSPAEGRDKIMALRARQIKEIIIYDKPMSRALFGLEGGKNGLIAIQTKRGAN